ncbi:hypothetical protein [Sicyoidochytrium minutum DNA virus]|nr:hypothetical protein [Sicyoidochytrium minutum DNA virus]
MSSLYVPQEAVDRTGAVTNVFRPCGGKCTTPGLWLNPDYIGYISNIPGLIPSSTLAIDDTYPYTMAKMARMAREIGEKLDFLIYDRWPYFCDNFGLLCNDIANWNAINMPAFGMQVGDSFQTQKIFFLCEPFAATQGNDDLSIRRIFYTVNATLQTQFDKTSGTLDFTQLNAWIPGYNPDIHEFSFDRPELFYTLSFDLSKDDEWNYCSFVQSSLSQSLCEVNAFTLQRPSFCSIPASDDPLAPNCVDWFLNLPDGQFDAYAQSMCLYREDLPECSCLQRQNYDLYNIASEDPNLITTKDACWWQPCKRNSRTIWRTKEEVDATCPNDICVNIQKISNVTDSQITGLQQYIGCVRNNLSEGGDDPSDFFSPVTQQAQTYIYYILGGIGGIILLAAIVVVVVRANAGKAALKKKKAGLQLSPKEQQLAYKEELKIYNRQLQRAQFQGKPDSNPKAQGKTKPEKTPTTQKETPKTPEKQNLHQNKTKG